MTCKYRECYVDCALHILYEYELFVEQRETLPRSFRNDHSPTVRVSAVLADDPHRRVVKDFVK